MKIRSIWISLCLALISQARADDLRFFRLRAEEALTLTSFCLEEGLEWQMTPSDQWVTLEACSDLANGDDWVVYTRIRTPLRKLQWRTAAPTVPTGFQFVPAGSFIMGSPEDEPGRSSAESQREVTLNAFALQAVPVTYAQWNTVRNWAIDNQYPDLPAGQMGSHGNHMNTESDPVTYVSWYSAIKWLNARSEMEGKTPAYTIDGEVYRSGQETPDWNREADGYRLPTEAEWEYAARAGTLTATYLPIEDAGWFGGNSSRQTHTVGQKTPNPWGFHDLLGLVSEWCWDWWGIYDPVTLLNPTGPGSGIQRILRGGDFILMEEDCRAASRHGFAPDDYNNRIGLRPAISLPPREHLRRELTFSETLDFGPLWQNGSSYREFVLENTGDLPVSVEGLSLPSGVSGNFSGVLAPGETQRVMLSFQQSASAPLDEALSVISDANVGPETVTTSSSTLGVQPAPSGFATLPGGTYFRGSPADELGRNNSETRHEVIVSSFAIQRTPVTWTQWNAVRDWALNEGYEIGAGQKGSHGDFRNTDDDPVTNITWHDAVKWLNAKSEMEGLQPVYWATIAAPYRNQIFENPSIRMWYTGYRLPTEAEWEYAARAGTETAFFTGPITSTTEANPALSAAAWYFANSSLKTQPVGGKQANPWGLYDMLGNVSEWCQDYWQLAYPEGPVTDPTGPSTGPNRIFRGGSWGMMPDVNRAASRQSQSPGFSSSSIGFRPVIQTLPEP